MLRPISEADWRTFRELRSFALDRFCRRVLDEVTALAAAAEPSAHGRYLAVYDLIQRRNEELARAFDDPRRSTALLALASIRSLRLLSQEDLGRFSPETREFLERLSPNPHP